MRILVHDYPGYPFPYELSRELSRRGHTVCHAYASFTTGPKGPLNRQDMLIGDLRTVALSLGQGYHKNSLLRRRFEEIKYGEILQKLVRDFQPSVVISGNCPLDSQRQLQRECRSHHVKFVFWVQDLIGIATTRLLKSRLPILSSLVGAYYTHMEIGMLRASDAVVIITDDWLPLVRHWGVNERRVSVVPNWATIRDIPLVPKPNNWSISQGLAEKFCFLYSGTLGMKHNPNLLLTLCKAFQDDPDVAVIVASEGRGAEWLKEHQLRLGLDNLRVIGFQPLEVYPQVLSTADILVAILERDAGEFSVPSKVLTYLCAQKPVLLSVPQKNLAARIVKHIGAGVVVEPEDSEAFVAAARKLRTDSMGRRKMGLVARQYAEETFDIQSVCDRFEQIINALWIDQMYSS